MKAVFEEMEAKFKECDANGNDVLTIDEYTVFSNTMNQIFEEKYGCWAEKDDETHRKFHAAADLINKENDGVSLDDIKKAWGLIRGKMRELIEATLPDGIVDPRFLPGKDTSRLQKLAEIMQLNPVFTLNLVIDEFPPGCMKHTDMELDLIEGSGLTRA